VNGWQYARKCNEKAAVLRLAQSQAEEAMRLMSKHMIEHSPLGATAEAHLAIEDAVRALKPGAHNDLPLAIALQFYPGDQSKALRLARFLADLEPEYRDDVLLIFAERFDVEQNSGLSAAIQHCARKFPVTQLRSQRPGAGHLEGSWGLFAGIADLCYRNYCHIWPWSNVFFAEADGIPLRWDWIDVLKRAHAENLARDKRVTGSLMAAYGGHVGGSHVHHCSFWGDHQSLQHCRRGCAWDLFHAQVLKAELGSAPAIANLYGAQSISPSVFRTLGNEYGHAWLANAKDESAWQCAQALLPNTDARRTRRRQGSEKSEGVHDENSD
jgi:hypothetical protein